MIVCKGLNRRKHWWRGEVCLCLSWLGGAYLHCGSCNQTWLLPNILQLHGNIIRDTTKEIYIIQFNLRVGVLCLVRMATLWYRNINTIPHRWWHSCHGCQRQQITEIKQDFSRCCCVSFPGEERRRILVGFDIYCTGATCGLVSSVKTGGNSGGFLQERDTANNNLNISDCKTQTSLLSFRRLESRDDTQCCWRCYRYHGRLISSVQFHV